MSELLRGLNKGLIKGQAALAQYREKVKNGELPPPERLNPLERAKANPESRTLAVKGYCYDCSGGSREEVRLCVCKECPLWNFRM